MKAKDIWWWQGMNYSAGGYCAEYQAVYDSFTTKPSDEVAAAQNTMVKSLVDSGVWAKLDVFQMYAQESNGDGEALKNWLNTGTFDATLVNAPTFTALEGFTGDGTNSYINVNYNPSTDKINLSLNSASFHLYSRTDIASNVDQEFGAVKTAFTDDQFRVNMRNSSGNFAFGIFNDATATVVTPSSSGFFTATRDAADSMEVFRNGASLGTDSTASSALTNRDCYIGAVNSGSPESPSVRQMSLCAIGSHITEAEHIVFKNAVETYMDSNEKGVIA